MKATPTPPRRRSFTVQDGSLLLFMSSGCMVASDIKALGTTILFVVSLSESMVSGTAAGMGSSNGSCMGGRSNPRHVKNGAAVLVALVC